MRGGVQELYLMNLFYSVHRDDNNENAYSVVGLSGLLNTSD